jgi:TP901 family phage tail tape measure protein
MAMNLKSVLRIAAEVTGLQDVTRLEKGLEGAEKAARSAKDGFKAMLDSSAFQAAAAAAAGLGVAIGLSVKSAIDFEEAMADVRKVVGDLDPSAFQQMRQEIMRLSEVSPLAAKDFAAIFAAAGQAGIATEEISAFAQGVEKIAIAFDMTAEEAGTAFAKLRATLGLSQESMMDLADAINHLSNNTASTAPQIVDFMKRTAAAGAAAGLSAEQTAAFGAAMVAGGAEAEVAATSFLNMVRAFSAGPSATERQIGALEKLGYVIGSTADEERRLTQAVEDESRRRIAAARDEADQRLKEINRYYRDRLTQEQDIMDDEMSMVTKQIQRRSDAELDALRKEQDKRIDLITENALLTQEAKDREIEVVRELYEKRFTEIRDRTEQELTQQRRTARDVLTAIRDSLDDQREVEASEARARFEQAERIEEERKKMLIAKAKEAAAGAGAAAAEQLSKNLQQDAIGTITDFFERIRQLPQEAQLTVMSDFFGSEARALLPLIQNAELLEKTLGLVGDQSKYAGSTLEEFKNRMETTATRIKIAQGNLENLAIVFGENFVPALTAVVQLAGPVLNFFAWMITNVPVLGPALAIVTGAFVALVAIAPGLSALISLVGALGISVAQIAGIITVVQVAFSGLVTFLTSTILPALIAFFSGPAGWITLAVIAVGAMVIAFREPLGQFLSWLAEWAGKALRLFVDNFTKPFRMAWDAVTDLLPKALSRAGDGVKRVWESIANGVKSVARSLLQYIANTVNSVAGLINKIIAAYNRLPAPDIPLIPTLTIPQWWRGGQANRGAGG